MKASDLVKTLIINDKNVVVPKLSVKQSVRLHAKIVPIVASFMSSIDINKAIDGFSQKTASGANPLADVPDDVIMEFLTAVASVDGERAGDLIIEIAEYATVEGNTGDADTMFQHDFETLYITSWRVIEFNLPAFIKGFQKKTGSQ